MFLALDPNDVNGYVPLVPPVKQIQLVPSHSCTNIIKTGIRYSLGCLACRIILDGYVGDKIVVLLRQVHFMWSNFAAYEHQKFKGQQDEACRLHSANIFHVPYTTLHHIMHLEILTHS
jgi:hypothetical protein